MARGYARLIPNAQRKITDPARMQPAPCILHAQAILPFSLKAFNFLKQLALSHAAPKKTVKISTFCKVTTCCQQGVYKRRLKLVFTKTLKRGKKLSQRLKQGPLLGADAGRNRSKAL
jgi:hypothetical protein